MTLHGAAWCSMVHHVAVAAWYSMLQLGAAWFNMVQNDAAWCRIVQHGASFNANSDSKEKGKF